MMRQLKAAAAKAAARAASAKEHVRSAKALLKQARKVFKLEKKAAKQARRNVDAAAMATTVAARERPSKPIATTANGPVRSAIQKPARKSAPKTRKPEPKAPKPPDTLRSAADVAKSVIERLHAAPPVLAPAAVIPSGSMRAREPKPLPESPNNPSLDSAES